MTVDEKTNEALKEIPKEKLEKLECKGGYIKYNPFEVGDIIDLLGVQFLVNEISESFSQCNPFKKNYLKKIK